MAAVDLVTVAHRPDTVAMAEKMLATVAEFEPDANLILVDNTLNNRGFAAGCNLGARRGTAPIIGLLNPDTVVHGPFLAQVEEVFSDPAVVITGNRFGKPSRELRIWGCDDWVCGATFFVRRDFWDQQGGFDEQFWLYFEETDLIRRAQRAGRRVRSVELPMHHASPDVDPPADTQLKHEWFDRSAKRFYGKWGVGR